MFDPNKMRAFRIDAGMSTAELADMVSLTQRTISKYEHRQCEPNASTLERIALALSKDVGDFYTK